MAFCGLMLPCVASYNLVVAFTPSSFDLAWPYVTQCGLVWPCMSFYGRILSFLAVIDPNSFDLIGFQQDMSGLFDRS